MTRDYILWEMTFPEMMLYYSMGVEQHLKLAGLYTGDPEKKAEPPKLDEKSDHQAIYDYYMSQSFDPSTMPDDIQRLMQ